MPEFWTIRWITYNVVHLLASASLAFLLPLLFSLSAPLLLPEWSDAPPPNLTE